MNVTNCYRPLLVLIVLFLPTQASHAAEKHRIVMDRSASAGDIYRLKIEASADEASSTSLDGQKIGSESKSISSVMTVTIEVLSMHEDGGVQSAALKIDAFEGEHSGKPVELDTSKRLIVTGKADETTYAYEGGRAVEEEAAVELLDLITNYIVDDGGDGGDDGDSPDDEEIFNLQDPKTVGESWACNNELMATDLAKEGLVADPDQMKSEMTFVAVESHHDVKCAKLVVAIDFGSIDIPELGKQGFIIDQSEMKLALHGLLPLDPEAMGGIFELEMAMTMSANADIDQGKLRLNVENGHTVKLIHLPMEK